MNPYSTDYIETSSGIAFYPYDPKIEDINVLDIAQSISQLCRFGGHTKHFYSVAQHSIWVYKYLKENGASPLVQLYGLLHDATEGYMVDLPTPIKKHLTKYKAAEDNLHDVIWDALKIKHPSCEQWKQVKEVDMLLQHHEANFLLPKAAWSDKTVKLESVYIQEEKMSDVKEEFLLLYRGLINEIR
ncbi:hypothetical protein [Viridibacillus arvi]|uniref:hypothetical protein n=1 Tax=Viridibacillus arvi TaxID=263475 RepID=UPI0034CDD83D